MCPKVSVTVPVFNTSNYLRKCLDSLKVQTFQDIEFIVVDDGSTDDSGLICDEYAKQYPNFKIIHQANGGLASARETGLQNSIGDFIIVCDSDDWVEPDMYESLYRKAISTGADIVTCGFFTEYDNGVQSNKYTVFREVAGIVDNNDIIARGAGWSWVKLIRRSLLEENDIHYEPGINLSEDSLILYKLMKLNPKVVQIDKPLYHYRRVFGGNSYTNNLSMDHMLQLNYTYSWLKTNYCESIWEDVIQKRAIDLAFACLRTKNLDAQFFKRFLKEELPYKSFLKRKISLKALVILSSKIISFRFSKFLVNNFYSYFYR